jgi:hypothetical protein
MLVKILVARVSGNQFIYLQKGYSIQEFMSELLPHGMEN